MSTSDERSPAPGLLLTIALTLAGAVLWSWPLAKSLSRDTLVLRSEPFADEAQRTSKGGWDLILANDQNLSIWGAAENARALASADAARLVRQGQCWPMPASTTLGEHMIELGILALPWWILTGDPIASYNLTFAAALVIASSGMFLFLRRHTGSAAGSLVGALAFAFATPRLMDLPYHPAVIGTHWIPWVLWSFDRAVARESVGAFVLFAATLLLSGLVGSYPLIAMALVGAAYGAVRLLRARREEGLASSTLLLVVAAALPAVAIVGGLLVTYAQTHVEWMLVPNTGDKFVVFASDYIPGRLFSVGLVSVAGLVPLVLLRGREGRGATAGLALATAAAFLFATAVPVAGGETRSVFQWLADRIALLDSVRAPGKVALAVAFGVQALGAIGWSRVLLRMGRVPAAVLAALLVAVIAIEVAPPAALRPMLGTGAAMQLRPAASTPERIETFRTALAGDDRPLLDLPLGRMAKAPLQLLDAAYHGHATSACYNSLVPPTLRAAYALRGARTVQAVDELAASGFGFVVDRQTAPGRAPSKSALPPPALLVAHDERLAIWKLPAPGPVHDDVSKLSFVARSGATRSNLFAPDPPHELDLEVTNNADAMWKLPDPVHPLVASVEFVAADGTKTASIARGVLPLALSARAKTVVELVVFSPPPSPGDYTATVVLDGIGPVAVNPAFRWTKGD